MTDNIIIETKRHYGYDAINITPEEAKNIGTKPDSTIAWTSSHLIAYTCDLAFGIDGDDDDSYTGVVYYFDHYVIRAPHIITQTCTDIREDLVNVTYLLEYREDIQVLMRKNDLNQAGFRLYLAERISSCINFLNATKFPASKNLENIKCYRDLATTLNFINKYNIDVRGYNHDDDYILIWSTDNDEKVYKFELVTLPKAIEQIPSEEWLDTLRGSKCKKAEVSLKVLDEEYFIGALDAYDKFLNAYEIKDRRCDCISQRNYLATNYIAGKAFLSDDDDRRRKVLKAAAYDYYLKDAGGICISSATSFCNSIINAVKLAYDADDENNELLTKKGLTFMRKLIKLVKASNSKTPLYLEYDGIFENAMMDLLYWCSDNKEKLGITEIGLTFSEDDKPILKITK